jgi:hypothetical protein
MTDEMLLDAIEAITASGGDVRIAPVDSLNPRCGYAARVTLATRLKAGDASYLGGGDTARAALAEALQKVPALARLQRLFAEKA